MSDGLISENRKARHEFVIEETLEAGLVLTGLEIKAIRAHKVNLTGAHARVLGEEAFLVGCHIAIAEGDQLRSRKLLLHKKELNRLRSLLEAKRQTIVPLKLYMKHGWAKALLGVGRRKSKADRREELKKLALE